MQKALDRFLDHLALKCQRAVQTKLGRAVMLWLQEIVWLLEYEPTWFPEFGFAVAAIGWATAAFFTDDITIRGWDWLLPCLAVAFGIFRIYVLLHLWYSARVVLATLGAMLWAWLWWGMAGRYGAIPMMGVLFGVFTVELLTAAKFSIPCARDLIAEYHVTRLQA